MLVLAFNGAVIVLLRGILLGFQGGVDGCLWGCGRSRGVWGWLWLSCGIALLGGFAAAFPGEFALDYHFLKFRHFPNISQLVR